MRYLMIFLAGGVLGAMCMGVVLRKAPDPFVTPVIESIARPLDAYSIPQLASVTCEPSTIHLTQASATTSAYTVWEYAQRVCNVRTGKPDEKLTVTGLVHIPTAPPPDGGFPVIVQFRGYADRSIYAPGMGTRHSAEVFASNGFISIAPDFLGYGGSSMPSDDIFEERFQTYSVARSTLSSVRTVSTADASRVGIWGHSNGGHIALTVLESVKDSYPLVLWAPVTKPFPYSILYYTDEADDTGKFLRKKLAEFERIYDPDLYALTNYLEAIKGPVQIHQGTSDDAVPVMWTDEFVPLLETTGVDVEYFRYSGADHNLTPGWDTVIRRDIEFFREHLL